MISSRNSLNFGFVLLSLLLNLTSLYAEGSFQKGILLLKNGDTIEADFTETNDAYFVRSEKMGKYIRKSDTIDIVSNDYFQKVHDSNPWKSSLDSVLYFNSSASYQWNQNKESIYKEDLTDRIVKISLILLTGYFYFDAQNSNEALKRTYTGFNSNAARDRFQRSYTNYQIAGALTIFTFTFSAMKAYFRFGRNVSMDHLGIENRKIVTLDEYGNDPKNLNWNLPNNSIELSFAKAF